MEQEKVWDEIAEFWNKFRDKPPLEVQDFLKNKSGKILDLGCGSGRNFTKNDNITFYGVDFSEKMLKFAEKKIKDKNKVLLFKAKAEELPFEDNFFDGAICISTLHCIEGEKNRETTIKELYRVMKKEAEIMVTSWTKHQSKKLLNFDVEGYVEWKSKGKTYKRYTYLYDESELKRLLEKIGFNIIKSKSWVTKSKHSKKNIIFYCKK